MTRLLTPTLCLAGGLALAIALGVGACVTQPDGLLGAGGGLGAGGSGSGTGGSAMGGSAPDQGKQLFEALEPTMYAACGPGCHEAGGIADAPFLAGPDQYQSITSWPGIITSDPTQSKLETYPVAGPQHPYRKLDQPPLDTTLFPQIKAWLAAEAAGIVTQGAVDAGSPYVQPFVPIMGFNAVYLTPIGPQFSGMAITFDAALVTAGALELSDIEVHPTSTEGIHIVHPLFVVNPVGQQPDPDPVDSFSNVDQEFPAGQTGTLGPGTMILTNWQDNAKLSLAFQQMELLTPPDAGAEGGTVGGCKDVGSFTTNAKPALDNNCFTCHGGASSQAQGAVDMSQLDSDPAAACAQVKNRVDPASADSSQIFVTTDPSGNAAHPYKFGGSSSKFDAFKASVSQWIQAEQ